VNSFGKLNRERGHVEGGRKQKLTSPGGTEGKIGKHCGQQKRSAGRPERGKPSLNKGERGAIARKRQRPEQPRKRNRWGQPLANKNGHRKVITDQQLSGKNLRENRCPKNTLVTVARLGLKLKKNEEK